MRDNEVVLPAEATIDRAVGPGRTFPIDPPFRVPRDGIYLVEIDTEAGTARVLGPKEDA